MLRSMSVGVALLGTAFMISAASGQLVATSGVGESIGNDVELFTELPGGEFNAWNMTTKDNVRFRLTGDGVLDLDLDRGTGDAPFRGVNISGWQQFDVGPWPTAIEPEIMANFKLVNAGGRDDWELPKTIVHSQLIIWESGTFDVDRMEGDLGEWVLNRRIETVLGGNGYTVVDEVSAGEPFVLLPGVNYTMAWDFSVISIIENLYGPQASVYLEAGGVSEFDGLTITLNPRTVPGVGGVVLLACGGGVVAVRRRRRGG